ncbi:MAG: GspE/PulE family protein [Candidatus Pacebacteria bacterium]|nr:GspE/PulE family protein [Candidatus Paceibacterota bacterium]
MEETSKKTTGEIRIADNLFFNITKKVDSIDVFNKELSKTIEKSTSEILETIMGGSVFLGVSDIHIEPTEENAKLRVRLDGILQDVFVFDLKTYKQILSRIKLLSGIKLNLTQISQDGRFSVSFPLVGLNERGKEAILESQEYVEIRVSSLPSEYGESLVLRILNPNKLVEIEKLGLTPGVRDVFFEEIKKPNGMIIVTGPTGSGKTTTLYAILKELRKPEIKIITIEDPVEYHLSGISQTEVHHDKGYDFANGLRAIVRQDPDVVLVGEVRDLETAQISLQAALTGHLVLTTLHTNDAAGAIARLQSLGEQPNNIAPALNVVIAQRLVRKVCPECSIKRPITKEEYDKVKKGLSNTSINVDENIQVAEIKGCKKCNNTGYKGRVGIFETLQVNSDMENFIFTSPSSSDIKEKAIQNGMLTLYQDGLIKVINCETTMSEVDRVAFEK